MKIFSFNGKIRLLFLTGALFVAAATASAQTPNETTQLMNQLNQIQNQIQTLSRAVYRGDKSAMDSLNQTLGTTTADTSALAATAEVRMSQIEDQQRKLTGQLEKINFDIQQLKERMDRLQTDTEQRFKQQSPPPHDATPTPPTLIQPPASGTIGTLRDGNGTAESTYEEAFAAIRDGKYDRAEEGFKKFLSQYPGHPLSSNAQYWLGETYYVRGDYKTAARTFAQNYQDFPQSGKAADSLLKLGLSLSKLGRKDDACLSLHQLQKEFPSDTSPLQKKALAEIKELGCP